MDFSAGGIAFALNNSTFEGKMVLVTLGLLSLVGWTVIINKYRLLLKAKSRTRRFLAAYSEGIGPLDVYERGPNKKLVGSPIYDVYMMGCGELTKQFERYESDKLPNHGLSAVRIALERGLGEAAVNLESGMIILATAISGGPFIGLLGTIWGVMDTFSAIGRAQQASIAAIAPGVAAALVTTLVGLLVAIPSLFCYNFLHTKIKTISLEMDNFAAHLESVFTTEFHQPKGVPAFEDDEEDYLVSSLLSSRSDTEEETPIH